MKRAPTIVLPGLLLALAWPGAARSEHQEVICESNGNQYQHCTLDLRNAEVELVEQLSRSPCDRDRSWGVDRDGIWVDDGCRARFRIETYDDRGDDAAMVPICHNVLVDRMRREARARDIRFQRSEVRRLNRDFNEITGFGEARDGDGRQQNFDYRCEVDVRAQRIGRVEYEWRRGGGHGNGHDGERELTCESVSRRYQHCAVDRLVDAELVEQLSRSECIYGRSWGFDAQGVWVDEGCRARFSVRTRTGRPPETGWDGTRICQDAILGQVHRDHGAGSRLSFDRPRIENAGRNEQLISGSATISGRVRQVLDYQCRVNPSRQLLVRAEYDLRGGAQPPTSPRPPAGNGPVDLKGAIAVCEAFVAERVKAERGRHLEVIYGVVTGEPVRSDLAFRAYGRGGTFSGRKRDATFNFECVVDKASGRIESHSYRYD